MSLFTCMIIENVSFKYFNLNKHIVDDVLPSALGFTYKKQKLTLTISN